MLAIVGAQQQVDFIGLAAAAAPFHLQHSRRIARRQAHQLRTIVAVDADAASTGDEAEDGVAGHRLAAARQRGQQVADAFDDDRVGRALTASARWRRRLGFLSRLAVFMKDARHLRGRGVAQRDRHVQLFRPVHVHALEYRRQVRLAQAEAFEVALQQIASFLHVACLIEAMKPVAHLVAGARSGQVTGVRQQPVAARRGGLAGEDLDAVAGGRMVGQRYDATVDLGTPAAVTDFGVHMVCEIQHRGAAGEIDDVTLGGQRIHAILDQFSAEAGQQGAVVVALFAVFEQLPHPVDLALEALVAAATLLVAPVRGDAQLGVFVHLPSADLHLQGLAFEPRHRGVQRLVLVALGIGDVIVELAGNVVPQAVHHAQRGVAGADILHQDADGADVVKVAEVDALALHLLPDAVDVLGAPGDIGALDAGLGQRPAYARDAFADETFAVAAALVEQPRHALVGVWLQVAESQILQFPLELPDAEPVGQRCMDVGGETCQRLTGVFVLARGQTHAHHLPRQQDQHHAQVADDGKQQPAQPLGVATGLAAIDVPDLARRLLALHQGAQHRMPRQQRLHAVAVRAQHVQQGGRQRFGIGVQAVQRRQHLGSFHGLRMAVRPGRLRQRERLAEALDGEHSRISSRAPLREAGSAVGFHWNALDGGTSGTMSRKSYARWPAEPWRPVWVEQSPAPGKRETGSRRSTSSRDTRRE